MTLELNRNALETGAVSLENIVPPAAVLELLSPEEAQQWRVLPLQWHGGKLYLASPNASDPALRQFLERRTGWPVELQLCSEYALQLALARAYSLGGTAASISSTKVELLAMLSALYPLNPALIRQVLGEQARSGRDWLDLLLAQGALKPELVVALRAAHYGYPHLRSLRFQGHKGLRLLVPSKMATQWQIVPFKADAQRLWIYLPDDNLNLDVATLSKLSEMEIRPVLVARSQWYQAYNQLYEQELTEPNALPHSTDEILLRGNWLTKAQKARGRETTTRNRVSIAELAREHGWLNAAAWQEVEAARWEISAGLPKTLPAANLTNCHFAAALYRRWRIVPLYLAEDCLHVGLAEAENAVWLPGVAATCGQPVKGYLLNSQQFRLAWQHYYANTQTALAPLPNLAEWLVEGAYLTDEQLSAALETGDLAGSLPDKLLAFGMISPLDLAEVLSLHNNLPWFPLEHPPQGLTAVRQQELGLDSSLLALLETKPLPGEKPAVLIAVSDPFAPLPPAPAVKMQPLIVPPTVLALSATVTRHTSSDELEFLRYLAQRGYIAAERLPELLERSKTGDQPLDLLLQTELAAGSNIYAAMADFSDLPLVELEPQYRQETVLDVLGRITRRTTIQDPVSLAAARTISLATAQQWQILPIALQNNNLTIAIANPFDKLAREAIETAVAPLHISWVVAPRNEIDSAVNRILGHKNIGTHLLESGIITVEQLTEALTTSQHSGVRLGRALVQLRYLREEELVAFLAKQHNFTFFDLDNSMFDADTAKTLPEELARRWGGLPVYIDDNQAQVAMLDPLDSAARAEISGYLGKDVMPLITTEAAFEATLDALYSQDYTYRSTQGLLFRSPEESAFRVITKRQKWFLIALLAISVIWLIFSPVSYLVTVNFLATLFYLAFSIHRFYLVYHALSSNLEVPVSPEEIAALDDRELPVYTILVPVYREAAVLPKLMRSITSLDYPLVKLDVKILMEENDPETIAAARALNLPPNFQQVIVPNSKPKTKPKACNYGLIKARGEFIVIFDAEDLPEPDQLKKAVVAFHKAGPQVACVQAKLNYFNRNQNLLTRWFTIEYSMWFDLFLPGLDASNAPVPLGGTSNHFRRERLDALGAWDPFNVTEDADLGVRLYKQGYKTAIIDSTTYEEANSDFKNWIRQRSRWVKGYIQTWLVHMRHPLALRKAIGTKAFLAFNLTVGGTFLAFLLNPIYWLFTACWFLTHWGVIQQVFPPIVYYLAIFNLFVGNIAFIYMNMAGCLRRGFDSMVKYALISPLYWMMMSIGAWKGFLQLMYKPFYWEKTIHGLDKNSKKKKH